MPREAGEAADVWDMVSAARDAQAILGGMSLEEFKANRTFRLAIERCMEILGEAARRVSIDTQQRHTEIAWADIIGQRNVIAHQYTEIDYEVLYRTVREHLPRLIEVLERVLQESEVS